MAFGLYEDPQRVSILAVLLLAGTAVVGYHSFGNLYAYFNPKVVAPRVTVQTLDVLCGPEPERFVEFKCERFYSRVDGREPQNYCQ